jgi:nitroreductase
MNPTELDRLMRCRRSVRQYERRSVEPDKIRRILDSARIAPSSCNIQPWHIVVADQPSLIAELALAAPVGTRVNKWMADAGAVFVLCAKPHPLVHNAAQWIDRDCHRLDMGIAGEHMALMATALGLGSCWIGWFSEGKVRSLLDVPAEYQILGLLVVGYAAGDIRMEEPAEVDRRRKRLGEIASHNRFGETLPEEVLRNA